MSTEIEREFKGNSRFTVEQRLGSGAFGVVYRVHDKDRNLTVALKTLRQDNAKALLRFKKEFRALADVNHPNLVTLYELFSDGEQWFFTMELVEGMEFVSYVRSSAASQLIGADSAGGASFQLTQQDTLDNPLAEPVDRSVVATINTYQQVDFDKLRASFRQLAEGLNALHKAGKLHRDIKPPNVLVNSAGRVVILDFGLVTELDPGELYQSLDFAGTPNYMSPEQAAGLNITPASDWYSSGVILFEALTGMLPYTGKFYEVLNQKQNIDAPVPSQLAEGIPEDLDNLCQQLLRREPSARPDGDRVLALLGAKQHYLTKLRAPLFIGRERHLSELRAAYEASKQSRTVIVRLHGRAGIGKSLLIRHFFDELQKEEVVLLAGRCYEQESLPYKAMDSLVDRLTGYLKRLSLLEAEALMPHDILALARLFPVLRQVEAVAGARRKVLEIPDSLEFRRRAFGALRELLTRIADRKPLVLFIDDLQWGDTDSAVMLSEILRPPDAPALLFIAGYNIGEALSSPLLSTLLPMLESFSNGIDLRELHVNELTSAEAKMLALQLIDNDSEVAHKQAELIAAESGGNPFIIDELVQFITFEATESNSQPAAITFDDVVKARVGKLNATARALLEIVAIAGRPVELSVARRATGAGSDDPAILTTLKSLHLVRMRGMRNRDEIEIFHERIRDSIIAAMAKEQIKSYHLHLAMALEASEFADPERLAHHFNLAGDYVRAGAYAIDAAEQAAEALAFDHAARLYRYALEVKSLNDGELIKVHTYKLRVSTIRISTLYAKLGDALANAGRGVEAARSYLEAAQVALAAERLDLQRRAAEQLMRSGHMDEGLALLKTVLSNIGLQLPPTPRRALLSLIWGRLKLKLRGLKFQERDASQISAEELSRIDNYWSVTMGLSMVDILRSAELQAKHLMLALKAGEPYRIARALALEVTFSASAGLKRQRETEKLINLMVALAERIDTPRAIATATLESGRATWLMGRWKKAAELCERAETLLREKCTGVARELDNAQLFLFRSLYYLGELEKIANRLPTLINEAHERGDLYAETNLRTRILYFLRLMSDEPELASKELRQAIADWSMKGFHAQNYFEFIGQAEIALYCGNGELAWQIISERWPILERSMLLRVQFLRIETHHLRARAAIAVARAKKNSYNYFKQAKRDAATIEREQTPYGNASARAIRAALAALANDRQEAATLLSVAEAGFTDADMNLFAMSARRRRAELLGGERGRVLMEEADSWMVSQRIKAPERMAALLLPGQWSGK